MPNGSETSKLCYGDTTSTTSFRIVIFCHNFKHIILEAGKPWELTALGSTIFTFQINHSISVLGYAEEFVWAEKGYRHEAHNNSN